MIIPRIMASQAYQDHGAIIIWTDETESTDDTNTTLPEIIISPLAKGNAYASPVVLSHSSDLRTMDELFGLAFQTNAIPSAELNAFNTGYDTVAAANDLSDLFLGASGPNNPLPAPTGLTVIPREGQAYVSWNAVSNAVSYTLYYGTNQGGPYTLNQTLSTGTTLTVANLMDNLAYYFVVGAQDAGGTMGLLSAEVSATPAFATTNYPYVGVTCIAQTVTSPRLMRINVVDIDMTAPGLRFQVTAPSGPQMTISQPTLSYLTNINCQIAINANFFSDVNGDTPTPETVYGIAASDGDIYSPFSSSWPQPGINFDPSNNVSIVHQNPNDPTGMTPLEPVVLWNAVAGNMQIVTNGVAMTSTSGDSLNPRSGIGITANNHLILMTIDGRETGVSLGAYIAEMAQIMQSNYGVYNGLNLDGGGSTTLALASPVPHIVNLPSDVPPRADGNNLGIFAQQAFIAITGLANGSCYAAPANLTLTADVVDMAGSVTNVTYYQNGISLGAASAAPYRVAWTNVTSGSYALTAVATDNTGLSVTSAIVNVSACLQPALASFNYSFDGGFSLCGSGSEGRNYILLMTSNLNPPVVWVPVTTNIADGSGAFTLSDALATNSPSRFYRVQGQ